jgi:hypothetical protein
MFTNWQRRTGTSAPSGSRVRSRSRAMRLEQLEDRLALSTGPVSAATPGALVVPPPVNGPIKPGGEDPFKFGFDENGHAVYQLFNFNTGRYGPPVRAQSFVDKNRVLNYILPELVTPGDVKVVDDDGVSDLLRFTTVTSPGSPSRSVLQYFSDPGADRDKADHGFSSNTTFSVKEIGPEGLNFFEFVAGGGDPHTTNFYDGISDFTEIQGTEAPVRER